MKKKPKIMLHMHQLRDFIDDRYSFWNNYSRGIKPKHYQYKGVQKAFQVGSAVDFGIKTYYENLNKINDGIPDVNAGDNVLSSQEFKTLPSKVDQITVMSLINAYISRFHSTPETKEYFHSFQIVNWEIPFIYTNRRRFKYEYLIYCSPDLVACTYWENKLVIIEIKTSGDDPKKYSAETLDFQTMTYCWASYRWNFKIPVGVIKRTLMKPRIKQKKDETNNKFIKRLITDIATKEDKYFKSNFQPVNLQMIKNYENYLREILWEFDSCLKSNNKYKYWKQSSDYWGM